MYGFIRIPHIKRIIHELFELVFYCSIMKSLFRFYKLPPKSVVHQLFEQIDQTFLAICFFDLVFTIWKESGAFNHMPF